MLKNAVPLLLIQSSASSTRACLDQHLLTIRSPEYCTSMFDQQFDWFWSSRMPA